MKGRTVRVFAVALAALAAAAVPFLFAITAWPEVVTPSYLIAHGVRMYDDIKFPHTPLLTTSLALASLLVGEGALWLRGGVAVFMGLTAALVVLGVRRRPSIGGALAGLLVGVPAYILLETYTDGPALWYEHAIAPILLAAALFLERFEATGRPADLVASGIGLGAAVLTKQTSAWASLAALAWLLARSRRRSARSFLLLAGAIAAPYAFFLVAWGAAYRTTAHFFWTFTVPVFHPFANEIGVHADTAALHESIVLFFPLAAFALLRKAAPSRRAARSPAAWVAFGGFGTAWPRFGLFHFAASIGILALLLARGSLLGATLLRRFRREGLGRALLPFSLGSAFLLVPLGVLAFGAAPLLFDKRGGPIFFWNDANTRSSLQALAPRVRPGEEIFVYEAPHETLYPILHAFPPGRFYVDPVFWYCLDKDGAGDRVIANLKARPSLTIFFREPPDDAVEVKATALYRFLSTSTVVVEKVDARTSIRKVR